MVEDTDDVYFVPAFTGLGTPHWDMYAEECLWVLQEAQTKSYSKSGSESMAYQTVDVIDCMQQCSDVAFKVPESRRRSKCKTTFNAVPGRHANCDVVRPVMQETTSLGAAFLAGLAVGFWKDVEELKGIIKQDRIFVPKDFFDREYRKKRWHEAIKGQKLGQIV